MGVGCATQETTHRPCVGLLGEAGTRWPRLRPGYSAKCSHMSLVIRSCCCCCCWVDFMLADVHLELSVRITCQDTTFSRDEG